MTRSSFAVLSEDEIAAIHAKSLEVLADVGVRVLEPRASTLLQDAGVERDRETDRIRIPEALVREALRSTPKEWTWHARAPRHSLHVGGGGRTRLGPGSACTHIIDDATGERRPPTLRDAEDLVRLMDALEYVSINYTPVQVADLEGSPRFREVATLVRDIRNTSKVLVGPSFDGTMARDGLAAAAILAGGEEALRKRPTLAGYCDPVGPLVHDRAMTETLVEYAAMGQPVFLMCLDLAGASAPASLAGTLVQQNAEILSGLLIVHLVNKDAPVIYGCVSGTMDMKAGGAAVGGPEFGLLSAAAVQLAHSYGLPCSTGGQSDAKTHDAQAALEKSMSLLASVLAGADFVDLFFGSFDGYNSTSLEQVVIDHDIAGYAFRYAEGIEVGEESLSLDLIKDVGPGGSFLRSRLALRDTMRRMPREHYSPSILDRRASEAGTPSTRSLLQAAHAEAERILRDHRPESVDPETLRRLDAFVDRIRKESS